MKFGLFIQYGKTKKNNHKIIQNNKARKLVQVLFVIIKNWAQPPIFEQVHYISTVIHGLGPTSYTIWN